MTRRIKPVDLTDREFIRLLRRGFTAPIAGMLARHKSTKRLLEAADEEAERRGQDRKRPNEGR